MVNVGISPIYMVNLFRSDFFSVVVGLSKYTNWCNQGCITKFPIGIYIETVAIETFTPFVWLCPTIPLIIVKLIFLYNLYQPRWPHE